MRAQGYDEIAESSDAEAEHLLEGEQGDESESAATPHTPWRNVGVAISVAGK